VPLNKVWFLTYFCCLYLFLYISFRLYTYLFIISVVNSLQFIVHRIIINFHINTFTHLPIYTSTHLHIHTFTHLHINLLTHSHTQGSISTGKTRQCVEIVKVRKPLLQENSGINHNTTTTANILPQEGTSQGYYLYGGGEILPAAIVFIIFLYSIVRWSTTIVTIATIATIATFVYRVAQGRYLYGGGVYVPPVENSAVGLQGSTSTGEEGCHPYPLLLKEEYTHPLFPS
jgi:hypothetical protein